MAENIQKGFISELINIFKLLTIVASRNINVQIVLGFAALLTFGLGDGVTAALMMDAKGTGIEANPLARDLFITQGFAGFVAAKVWMTLVILFAAFIIQLKSQESMYWTINGFLAALTAGGLMAVYANLSALAGRIPPSPGGIIFAYLALVLILTEIGSFVDKNTNVGCPQ